MKRSTLYVLVALVVLAGLYLLLDRKRTPKAPEPLAVPGYMGNVTEKESRTLKKEKPCPYDKVELKRKGQAITLVKTGADKDGNSEWAFESPFKGRAQNYKVRDMVEAFAPRIESSFAKEVTEKDLRDYGLDADNAIEVKVYEAGAEKLHLVIGSAEKPDRGGEMMAEPDTWVHWGANTKVAYRIPARDLRRPFDVEVKELRDKRVIDLKRDEVSALMLENPASTISPKVVVRRPVLPPKEPEKKDEKKEGEDAEAKKDDPSKPRREDNEGWTLEEPKGFSLGEVSAYLAQATNVSAQEFLDASALKGEQTGLDDPKTAFKLTVEAGDKKVALWIGNTVSKGGSKDVYAKLDGTNEVFRLSEFAAKALRKDVGEFRDRRLVQQRDLSTLQSLDLTDAGKRSALVKSGGTWTFTSPAGYEAGKAPLETYENDLKSMRFEEFVADPGAAKTGLDAPATVLRLGFAGGDKLVIELGKEDEGKVWGRLSGSTELFRIAKHTVDRLRKKPDDLRNRKLFAFTKDDLVKVSLKSKEETVVLERDLGSDTWKITAPEAVDNPKESVVASVVSAFANLEARDFVDGKRPEDVGLGKEAFVATGTAKDGKTYELRISLDKMGDNPYASSSEAKWRGKVVTVTSFAAKGLEKKVKDFKD